MHKYFVSLYLASSSPEQESRKEVSITHIYKLHGLKVLKSLPQPLYQSYSYYKVVTTYLNLFLIDIDMS